MIPKNARVSVTASISCENMSWISKIIAYFSGEGILNGCVGNHMYSLGYGWVMSSDIYIQMYLVVLVKNPYKLHSWDRTQWSKDSQTHHVWNHATGPVAFVIERLFLGLFDERALINREIWDLIMMIKAVYIWSGVSVLLFRTHYMEKDLYVSMN